MSRRGWKWKLMKTAHRSWLWLVGVLALALLPGADQARGQGAAEPRAAVPLEGSEAFRALLSQRHLKPVREIDDLRSLDPAETILIVFGDLKPLDKVRSATRGLVRFQNRGGAILIASDRPDPSWQLRELKVRVAGQTVRQRADISFLGLRDCPLITHGIHSGHPLFRDIALGIATNKPSYLEMLDSDLLVLATHSDLDLGFPLLNLDLRQPPSSHRIGRPGEPPFIAGSSSDSGPDQRVVVIAGHGVFMNEMLANNQDNFYFARNCVDWLTEGGRRKHVLFLEERRVLTRFDLNLSQPLPVFNPTEDTINALLVGMEEEGFFEKLLDRYVGRRLPLQLLLVGLTIFLILRGLMRLTGAHFRREARAPLAEAWVEAKQTRRPIHAQRREIMLIHGNLLEGARDLARHWFDTHVAGEPPPEQPPRVVAPAGWWQRRRWQRRLDRLWELAYGTPLVGLNLREFEALLRETRRLSRELAAGRLRLDRLPPPGLAAPPRLSL